MIAVNDVADILAGLPLSVQAPTAVADAARDVAARIGAPRPDAPAAYVDMQPGDATSYKIAVIPPGPRRTLTPGDFLVSLTNLGKTYPWSLAWMHPDYVCQKWVGGESSATHTAAVLATFLNVLRLHLIDAGWLAWMDRRG